LTLCEQASERALLGDNAHGGNHVTLHHPFYFSQPITLTATTMPAPPDSLRCARGSAQTHQWSSRRPVGSDL